MTAPGSYDVFVSYAHADRGDVAQIVRALQSHGLAVWFDETSIEDFSSIASSIEEGIARAKTLLAYYSSTYPTRRPCQWELTAAYLAAQRDGRPERRVLVVNPEDGPEHILPIELRNALYRSWPPGGGTAELEDLARAVARHVATIDGPFGAVRPLSPPLWFGRRPLGSRRFVGRARDLWRVHSALQASEAQVLTSEIVDVAQIRGLGGVGKSLLAEEYALRFGAAYPGGVFWLSAFGGDGPSPGGPDARTAELERQLTRFVRRLDVSAADRTVDALAAGVADAIRRRGESCLWVVDDLPGGMADAEVQLWLSPAPLAKTLLTTRSRDYGASAAAVDLSMLTHADGLELLTARRAPVGDVEVAAAEGLVDDLGGHPQALDVAGASLAAEAGLRSFADFRGALADQSEDELELAGELALDLPSAATASIATTLRRSIDRLDEEGRDILGLASQLATAPIPAEFVAAVLADADRLDPTAARRRAAKGFVQCESASLVERTGPHEGAREVHALVSRVVRYERSGRERIETLVGAAANCLLRTLANSLATAEPTAMDDLLVHARVIAERGWETHAAIYLLVDQLARFDLAHGNPRVAAGAFAVLAEVSKDADGLEHPETLAAFANYAAALRLAGELDKARPILEGLVAVYETAGGDSREKLVVMDALAATLREQGELERAEHYQRLVCADLSRTRGDEHPDTLTARHNLVLILTRREDLRSARELAEHVLEARQRTLGADHPETLASMSALASVLRKQGELARAETVQRHVLDACQARLGPSHPRTVTAKNNLSVTLRQRGLYGESIRLGIEALTSSRDFLGPGHPTTKDTAYNLRATLQEEWGEAADLYREGHVSDALRRFEAVLTVTMQIFGPDDPDTQFVATEVSAVRDALNRSPGFADP